MSRRVTRATSRALPEAHESQPTQSSNEESIETESISQSSRRQSQAVPDTPSLSRSASRTTRPSTSVPPTERKSRVSTRRTRAHPSPQKDGEGDESEATSSQDTVQPSQDTFSDQSSQSFQQSNDTEPQPVSAAKSVSKRMTFNDDDDSVPVSLARIEAFDASAAAKSIQPPQPISVESFIALDGEDDNAEPESVSLATSRQSINDALKAESAAEQSQREQAKSLRKQLTAGRQAAAAKLKAEQNAIIEAEEERKRAQREKAAASESKKLRGVDADGRLDLAVIQAAEEERKQKAQQERDERKRQREAEAAAALTRKRHKIDDEPVNVKQHGAFTVVVAPAVTNIAYDRPAEAVLAFRAKAAASRMRTDLQPAFKARWNRPAKNFATVKY